MNNSNNKPDWFSDEASKKRVERLKNALYNTVTINVADYYGKPLYYSVMPQMVFDALETAYLNGDESVTVDKDLIDKMESDYKLKMERK